MYKFSQNQPNRPCSCGSGRESWEAHDARGLYLCRVCPACVKEKLSRYRPEVLQDPTYECDEPIEDDDYLDDNYDEEE